MPEKFVPRKIDISPQPVIVDPGLPSERVRYPNEDGTSLQLSVAEESCVASSSMPAQPQAPSSPPLPTCPVTFDLGAAGQVQMNYHRVIETQEAIALVYDNRFSSYGARFRPPVRSEPLTVEVHNKDIPVVSLGIEIPLAAENLHLTILLKANRDEDQETESEWDDSEGTNGFPSSFQSPLGDEL